MSDIAAGITQFLDTYGLIAIVVVMFVKGIGVPVPIPSDLLMLTAATQSATGKFILWQAFGAILIAMVVGGSIQYALARGLGRRFLYRFGRYIGLTQARLDQAANAVRKGGAVTVGVSLVTPGLRIAVLPACGLAQLPYRSLLLGLLLGSSAFLVLHFFIGYVGGPIVDNLLRAINLPVFVFIVAFLAIGLIGWMLMRRRARVQKYGAGTVTLERLSDWADASCPVCLVLGAANQLQHADS